MPNPAMLPGYFDPQTGMFYQANQTQQQMFQPQIPNYNPVQQTPQYTPQNTSQQQSPNVSAAALKGRVVEDISEVKPGEVPMDGSFCYYPKRDGTEIYVKVWGPKGDLLTFTFIPQEPIVEAQMTAEQSKYDEILRRLDDISDSLSKKGKKGEDK